MPERTWIPGDSPFDPETFREVSARVTESIQFNRANFEDLLAEVDNSRSFVAPTLSPPIDSVPPVTHRVAARHLSRGDQIVLGNGEPLEVREITPDQDQLVVHLRRPDRRSLDLCDYLRTNFPETFVRDGCTGLRTAAPNTLVETILRDPTDRGPRA